MTAVGASGVVDAVLHSLQALAGQNVLDQVFEL
jgi:hypothetical protein